MTYAELTARNRLLYAAAERCTVEMKLFFQYSPEWTELYTQRRNILKQIDENLEETFRKMNLKRGVTRSTLSGVKKRQYQIFQVWKNNNYGRISEIAEQTGHSSSIVLRAISSYLKFSKC